MYVNRELACTESLYDDSVNKLCLQVCSLFSYFPSGVAIIPTLQDIEVHVAARKNFTSVFSLCPPSHLSSLSPLQG